MVDLTAIIVACVTAIGTGITALQGYKGLKRKASIVYADKLDRKQHEYITMLESSHALMKQEVVELKGDVEHLTRLCEECSNERDRNKDKIIELMVELAQIRLRQQS